MELTFTKDGDKWVASFAVTSDFNIHIEKVGGRVTFFQSAVDGATPDATNGLVMTEGDGVLDKNVVGVICPMYITIKSDVLPTMAVVTPAEGGEVGYSEMQIMDVLNTPVQRMEKKKIITEKEIVELLNTPVQRMKYPTVSALCEGVAGAIREKEGTSALINPQDFVDRIKGLEIGGGGIPDVPTLECWKITTEDQDVKFQFMDIFNSLMNNRPLLLGTIGGDVYAGTYPIFGTGYPPEGVQTFYVAFFNTWIPDYEVTNVRDFLSANGGEKISLSTYLEVASTIISW